MQSETSDDLVRFQKLSEELTQRMTKASSEPVRGHLRRGDLPPPVPLQPVPAPVSVAAKAVPVNQPQNEIEQAIWDAAHRMASTLVAQHRATARKVYEEVYGK